MKVFTQFRVALSLHTLPRLGFSNKKRSFRATFITFCVALTLESVAMQLLSQVDDQQVALQQSAIQEHKSESAAIGSVAEPTPSPSPTTSIIEAITPSTVLAASTSQPQTASVIFHSPLRSYRLTQYFSSRHTAIDMADPTGTPIYASTAGTVVATGYVLQGGGLMVKISHPNGYTTYYAHMSAIVAKVGQYVDNQTIIGKVGQTGWATGPHLHFMVVNSSGRAVNPLSVIK